MTIWKCDECGSRAMQSYRPNGCTPTYVRDSSGVERLRHCKWREELIEADTVEYANADSKDS